MNMPETHKLSRHLIALALTAPVTTAIAVAMVLPFMGSSLHTRELFNIVGLMFCFGSLVGYCVELLLFMPLYGLVHRHIAVTGWSMTLVGALAGALPALLLHEGPWLPQRDPIEFVLSPVGLAALGALGGAIYWRFIREAPPADVPFNGLSGSQP